ncbi:ABC transporter permease [Nocardiopsis sp. EMB25]|uniref:ABC transporter permease n=1 Tax=Nocardiopsis sp. EMB25 TaxID=2835867 RepID=UPI0022835AC0|nr:ABC transporter permease [Nocardiopsis sp. EMB25]MCY9782303.1 ABC transporter permease [Nocardiopsis sp. EMB25]
MTTGERPLPGPLRIGLSRAWLEVREFTRHWESVAFTFALPALILLLFGTIFDGATGTEIPAADFYLPGLIAMGLMSVSFQNLAIAITLERDNGTLRRLRGTPMPPSAYFVGKTALVFVLALGQVAVLLAIAVGVYGADLPAGPKAWATMAWVFVLGTIACSLLGIAFSSLARSAKSASAIVIVPFLALQFTSGVFVPLMVLPDWLVNVASLFPLKWMAQGMRAAFYPAQAAALEPGGSWDLTTAAAVLGVWCVVGLALTLATFRWKTGKDG